ncbi:MFS transporter [Amycolatopsis nigrescens]|uniref:MFS transporter n=1 Tax=Amycolatopsis nigrescens TaxID=381445 RepID=UPI000379FE16|nr:MFS transporter [Amycolatopsis nigrescens]
MVERSDSNLSTDGGRSRPTAEAESAPRGTSPKLAFLGVLIGVFVIVLDTTIVNVAVPHIQQDLKGTLTEAQWVVNGYNLLFAALLLSAGAAADRLGGRKVYAIGLVVFALSSLLCGLAGSLPLLIAARALQGIGGAMMLPTALSLAGSLFPEPAARGRAFGQWAAVAGAATVLGPLVGGLLADSLSWRAIFFINLPIAAVALWLLVRNTPETATHRHRFDIGGQVLGIVMLAALALALTEAGRRGWSSPVVLGSLVVGVLCVVGTATVERRVAAPMIPPALVRTRQFSAASTVGLILSVGIYGQMFVLSLYMQGQRGYSAWLTGLALLPFAAVTVAGPLVAGKFIGRNKIRGTLLLGQLAGAAASIVLALSTQQTPYWTIAIGLVLLGVCQSASQPGVAAAALVDAPKQHLGIASGVMTSARQVGSVLGVALLGGLVSRQEGFESGMHIALLIVAALYVVGGVITATLIHSRREQLPA